MDVLASGRVVLVETLFDFGGYAGVVSCGSGPLAGVLGRVPGFGAGVLHLLTGLVHRVTGALSQDRNRESDDQNRRWNDPSNQVHGLPPRVRIWASRHSNLRTGAVSRGDHRNMSPTGSRRG